MLKYVGENTPYITLSYGKKRIRVLPEEFSPVAVPVIDVGEKLLLRDKPDRACEVRGVFWHYKAGRPFYLLLIDGKPASKRYWAEDFDEMTSGPDTQTQRRSS